MSYSKPDPNRFMLTPLGAALVEAMPDRQEMADIKYRFRIHGICPISKIFPTVHAVQSFYEQNPEAKMNGAK